MDTITIILGVIVIGLLILVLRLVRQNEKFSVANEELSEVLENYELWFSQFKDNVVFAYKRLQTIDASGHFQSDDEVGWFFQELKSIITKLKEIGELDENQYAEATANTSKIENTKDLPRAIFTSNEIERASEEQQ